MNELSGIENTFYEEGKSFEREGELYLEDAESYQRSKSSYIRVANYFQEQEYNYRRQWETFSPRYEKTKLRMTSMKEVEQLKENANFYARKFIVCLNYEKHMHKMESASQNMKEICHQNFEELIKLANFIKEFRINHELQANAMDSQPAA